MIKIEKIRKHFDQVVAVDEVSFTAQDGKITGLLGPNGAGKTTTMRIIAGMIQPHHGDVYVDGVSVVKTPMMSMSKLGVLPDARGIYPRLTARENIRYFGQIYGLSKDELEVRIEALAQMLDMQGLLDRRVHGFSQGERMKVALARAVIHDPHNIMLDEPTNGLDVMTTRAMRDVIKDFRDRGRCVLFSSHIMQEVSLLCDEIVVFSGGQVVAQGTADEIREVTGRESLEDAFVCLIGSSEGLLS